MTNALTRLFGRNLRTLRRGAAMSQEALAERAHVTKAYVSYLEMGQRNPPLETVGRLAAALHVEPSYMLQDLAHTESRRPRPTSAE